MESGVGLRPEGFDVTSQKQLKARIRVRMATTGERYVAARAQLIGGAGNHDHPRSVVDAGWTLRGGSDPDAAALANLLANASVVGPEGPLSEELILLATGGLGAGYILWEFQHDDSRIVTLGFTNSAQYFDRRLSAAVTRLGLDADWSRTSGAVGAAAELRRELGAGQPIIVWPDRYLIGDWQLPASLDGHGGHPVIAYAERDGRIHLDDRTLAPLTVAGEDVDRARARVGSYRNAMLAVRTRDSVIPGDRLRAAVRSGLEDMVSHHGGRSDSFAVPAWRKWARMLVASGPAKAWPRVFADGTGLFGALLSVWEGVEPAGMTGGNLRREFGAGLTETAALLDEPRLGDEAARWVEIAELWHTLAEAAVPTSVPACARARELTAAVTGAVAEGDAGRADRIAAAEELWALRDRYATEPPLGAEEITAVLATMSGILGEIYDAEKAGVQRLGAILAAGTR
ncbi:MAG TPA: BtrH N-terminal domain-containing protein [Jiangellaceae bacterium]|nr:BtrH N-terminal domain-containing protein [Jiangellaceae bacterium]